MLRPKRAVCNELFAGMSFEETCDYLAAFGFDGVEIAPFTLFERAGAEKGRSTSSLKQTMELTGIEYAGFHWLFSKPEGLHITSPDPGTRRRTREHLKYLLELSGELGGGNLILGSPSQRQAVGIPPEEAVKYLREELAAVADFAVQCNSKVLLEALPSETTRVVNTLVEARKVIEEIDHPGISGMFDFHNCVDEESDWPTLIRTYADQIEHVHLNTWDGDYPRPEQSVEYAESFRALDELGYDGWVSLEVFSEYPQPEELLEGTRRCLDAVSVETAG